MSVILEENVLGGIAAMVLMRGLRGAALVASHYSVNLCNPSCTCTSWVSVMVGSPGNAVKINVLTLGVEAGR